MSLDLPGRSKDMVNVKIRQLFEGGATARVPTGLTFDVTIEATTRNEAIESARRTADGIASFVTLTTGVGIPALQLIKCLDMAANKTEREYVQFYSDLPAGQPSRGNLNPQTLIKALDRYFAISDPKLLSRVARAVRWYRRGITSTDPFDRFSSYWIGMEALNKALQNMLDLKDEEDFCPNCSYSLGKSESMSGAKAFIDKFFDNSGSLFKSLRNYRVKIIHSTTDLQDIVQEVSNLAPTLGNIVLGAVNFVCGVSPPWEFPREIISNSVPLEMTLESLIISDTIEDVYPEGNDFPDVEVVHHLDSANRSQHNKFTTTGTTKFTFRIGPKARIRPLRFKVYGEGEGSGKLGEVASGR